MLPWPQMTTSCPKCGAVLRLSKKQPAGDLPSPLRCWMCTFTWTPTTDRSAEAEGPRTILVTPSGPRERSKAGRLAAAESCQTASLALPDDKTVKISVVAGSSQGMEYDLSRPLVTIGRRKGGADIEIDDPEVSSVHCAVEVRRDTILLHDLRSTNGTYLDDSRVFAARPEVSSRFRIGSSILKVDIVPRV